MALGSAGVRPSVMAFRADQFDQEGETGKKKRVQSYFNWFYFSDCVAHIMAFTVIVYIQSNLSWSFGFGVCTVFMLISTVFFLPGRPIYRHEVPQGSVLTDFAQVLKQGRHNHPRRHQTRRLLAGEELVSSWRVCSVEQIEGLKSIIKTLPIFSCGIVNQITIAKQHTFSVLQALGMDRKVGSTNFQISAGSFSVFSLLVIISWLPFYEKVILPISRRMTRDNRGITVFQRMGIGFAISALSMSVAGLVEVKRRNTARSHGLLDDPSAVVPISALWLAPQFCIAGLGEAFNAIGTWRFFTINSHPICAARPWRCLRARLG